MLSKNEIKLVKQLEQKKYRKERGLFVAEGPKVVGDLLRHGYHPQQIYATSAYDCPVPLDIKEVTDDELRKLSFLQHPQQVLGVFPINAQTPILTSPNAQTPNLPNAQTPNLPNDRPLLLLALDGVQDPGNLGTIIRIADWFGIDTIYCSQDTADAWNPKVVQATMGSIARVNIIYTDLERLLRETTLPVYGTLLDGEDVYSQELSSEGIIVMGNEGNGISEKVRPLINHRLFIPSYREGDTAESLNVAIATAITCAEFRRRKGFAGKEQKTTTT